MGLHGLVQGKLYLFFYLLHIIYYVFYLKQNVSYNNYYKNESNGKLGVYFQNLLIHDVIVQHSVA
jgi:hypothetical protein